jgi:hypothetical protein
MGDASVVEAPWEASWTKSGDVWYHLEFLLPSGSDARYPGKFTTEWTTPIAGQGWDMFAEWHAPNGSGASCTNMHGQYLGLAGYENFNHLMLKVWGGDECSPVLATSTDPLALQYDHWYDAVVHYTYSIDPNVGFFEWWLDGRLIGSKHTPTVWRWKDGSIHGTRYQVGLYRGADPGWSDTVYVDGVKVGSTQVSVQ